MKGSPVRVRASASLHLAGMFVAFAIARGAPGTNGHLAKTAVEFVRDKLGRFGFARGMNMVHGTLVVLPQDGDGREPAEEPERPWCVRLPMRRARASANRSFRGAQYVARLEPLSRRR
jgi:hypothetical protein